MRRGNFRHRYAVDGITQAALGAAIGEMMMGKRLGNRALAWGALFGIFPELVEFFITMPMGLTWTLACEGAFAHSPTIMALATWGIARGLARLWRPLKITAWEAGSFVMAVWCAHVVADCLTVKGAALAWPILHTRVSFSLLPATDFFVLGPLLVTVVWMAFLRQTPQKKQRGNKVSPLSKRRKLNLWGLGLAIGYAIFAIGLKLVSSAGYEADLTRRGTKITRIIESPMPYNPLLRRAVVERDGDVWVGYRAVYEFHETPVRWTIYPKRAESLKPVEESSQAKLLVAISNGWWLARPHARGAWFGDIRFAEARVWGSRKSMVDSRLTHSWVIAPESETHPLRAISPYTENRGDYLGRMAARTIGNRTEWEANPRLAGVAGSLPEFLAVKE